MDPLVHHAGLASGRFTFMFTDIEGSTSLIYRLGDRYPLVLEQHHRVIVDAVTAAGGVPIGTEGDAFFVVFRDPGDALRAALAVDRGLIGATWPDGLAVRVRIGLHTGDAIATNAGYTGIDIHVAARIAAAANGGQIVVSSATRALVDERQGCELVDLGLHRLKDLPDPLHLYGAVATGVADCSAPLRSLDAQPLTNLPATNTTFVGRDADVAAVSDRLAGHRVVTVVGTGGSGKSRLAIEVGRREMFEWRDGVWLVDLSTVAPSGSPLAKVTETLGLVGSSEADLHSVIDYLRSRQTLLLLDNCEHVARGCRDVVAALVARCPRIGIVATTRVELGIAGEVWPLGPLSVPTGHDDASHEEVASSDAVRLFVDAATRVQPGNTFDAEGLTIVGDICRRLDGNPLAIELAAARARILSPLEIRSRLRDPFGLLVGPVAPGQPAHHRSLEEVIRWSYDLLRPAEQCLFRAMAIFAGGAPLDGIEVVLASVAAVDVLDGVGSLVAGTLLTVDRRDSRTRFTMVETIRAFALQELVSAGEETSIGAAHLGWCRQIAATAAPLLRTQRRDLTLLALDREHDNFRIALDRSIASGDGLSAVELAIDLYRFWWLRGHLTEGRRWLQLALEASTETPPITEARAHYASGWLARCQGELQTAEQLIRAALKLLRGAGEPSDTADCLTGLGAVLEEQGNLAEAEKVELRALALRRRVGDDRGAAVLLNNLANIADDRGDAGDARGLYCEALELFERLGDDHGIALTHLNLGELDHADGDYEAAQERFALSLGLWSSAGVPTGRVLVVDRLAATTEAVDPVQARGWYLESLRLHDLLGDAGGVRRALLALARLAAASGSHDRAATLVAAAEQHGPDRGHVATRLIDVDVETLKGTLRSSLGAAKFEHAWREASSMTIADIASMQTLQPS